MMGDLKVVYVIDSVQVERCMSQSQLAELIKNESVLLISVNAPKIKSYRKKKIRKDQNKK